VPVNPYKLAAVSWYVAVWPALIVAEPTVGFSAKSEPFPLKFTSLVKLELSEIMSESMLRPACEGLNVTVN
jgi:hypothetical protein